MKRILVVGKTSYIGTSFAHYILQNFDEYAVDAISSRDNFWAQVDFSSYDVVFNVSGLCHADSKHGTEELYFAVNTELPIALATKAKAEGVKQFIQMSSMIVYGNMSRVGVPKTISRDTAPTPVNVYGESKRKAEVGLARLEDANFKVAIIRPPLVYGENARDNFPRLIHFAKKYPIFPNIENTQSMIYIDNFCELVRLIIDHQDGGVFLPQDKEYIGTSKLVKDVSIASNHNLHLTRIFNPVLKALSHHIYFINKVFGNIAYDKSASDYYHWDYCIVDYETAIKRIASKRTGTDV